MEFEVETAALKVSFQLAESVNDLLAIADENSDVVGLLFAHPKGRESKREELSSPRTKTPFAQLAPAKSSSRILSDAVVQPAAKAEAIRLFDGPCHFLPPVSHLAPIFIAQCLAPPPSV
ncbi:unnamed protein product [Strongylus vulgaris]|uniref:Uncharacterized protein n=1 Tax=Strongylus vulgaris TaxID=40348 RepID=A0A3P7ISA0_STRVU|nr:unnamed protein product [Strongylus vulgaris]